MLHDYLGIISRYFDTARKKKSWPSIASRISLSFFSQLFAELFKNFHDGLRAHWAARKYVTLLKQLLYLRRLQRFVSVESWLYFTKCTERLRCVMKFKFAELLQFSSKLLDTRGFTELSSIYWEVCWTCAKMKWMYGRFDKIHETSLNVFRVCWSARNFTQETYLIHLEVHWTIAKSTVLLQELIIL